MGHYFIHRSLSARKLKPIFWQKICNFRYFNTQPALPHTDLLKEISKNSQDFLLFPVYLLCLLPIGTEVPKVTSLFQVDSLLKGMVSPRSRKSLSTTGVLAASQRLQLNSHLHLSPRMHSLTAYWNDVCFKPPEKPSQPARNSCSEGQLEEDIPEMVLQLFGIHTKTMFFVWIYWFQATSSFYRRMSLRSQYQSLDPL